MKRVKEFSIKITEGDSCPIVKIDGEEVPHIAKVKFCFDSENAIVVNLGAYFLKCLVSGLPRVNIVHCSPVFYPCNFVIMVSLIKRISFIDILFNGAFPLLAELI